MSKLLFMKQLKLYRKLNVVVTNYIVTNNLPANFFDNVCNQLWLKVLVMPKPQTTAIFKCVLIEILASDKSLMLNNMVRKTLKSIFTENELDKIISTNTNLVIDASELVLNYDLMQLIELLQLYYFCSISSQALDIYKIHTGCIDCSTIPSQLLALVDYPALVEQQVNKLFPIYVQL